MFSSMPNPIAFSLFGLEIRWYGILIAAGILLAFLIVKKRAAFHHIKSDDIPDILLISVVAGVIGARAYYVLFNWSYYSEDFVRIFRLREGGLGIHGGLLVGIFVGFLLCRRKRIEFLNALDLTLPAVALAQAIGRWGNYFNGEAHGGPTDLPWAIPVGGAYVHPTFLYESIWCLWLFFFLSYMDKRRKFTGQIACLYGILYSLERFFVEALRTDSLMIGPFKQAQVLSLCVFAVCLVGYLILKKSNKKKRSRI